ncbi:methylmalonyl-CoA carboxyltransferase [Desulfuribacillus alkaliarsenatis]|uniref:Methylmalonyl-CoA carboxyltransferase n=1 Tax=Desulfuribacillus alkaliarsenatis TaxID=766136 RepID=A0A1E5G5K0_9FIRM|nr:acyl-CoA carboxylase subunit beta [Desulfuribacillus alkaliarsenatis]OEF98467.1 methylmalonyl-CoA carboxyltransferase [Desulfuribacillus alkaliarsenatis]
MVRMVTSDRIKMLFDEGSFIEVQAGVESRLLLSKDYNNNGDGVVTGFGEINGRRVFVYCQDFNVYGGSLGEMHGAKIYNIMDLALKSKAPIIGLIDSGGARIQEGVLALHSYGKIFNKNVECSGLIPQISVILGACAGGAVYSPALTDFVFMVDETSQMFITGPKVSQAVSGECIDRESLGGSVLHSTQSGVCHVTAETEQQVFIKVRELISFLPQNSYQKPPKGKVISTLETSETIASSLPGEIHKTYDIKAIIMSLVDDNSFYEIQKAFAKNVVIGFARIEGHVVAIVANQPKIKAGAIDIDAADKIARFVRFCDCFNVPIVTLVDVPGFIPGLQQETLGIIRHGAKILYAYAEATVTKITIIIRKAYGGAYVALNSKSLGADYVMSWPNSEVAVMGVKGLQALKSQKSQSLQCSNVETNSAAAYGMVDEVIEPKQTRQRVYDILLMLENKTEPLKGKKHGNIPL